MSIIWTGKVAGLKIRKNMNRTYKILKAKAFLPSQIFFIEENNVSLFV